MGERIAFAFLFAARRGNTRELAQSGNGKCTACTPGWVVMYNQQVRKRAGVVQWQYRSFPSFGRGFDSHRPLQKSPKIKFNAWIVLLLRYDQHAKAARFHFSSTFARGGCV